ncbi:hypothetical protein [uncultured Brevundimonas sp.]|uniref:hypothetical protein n=1 Tax=uncultured Brevundimonas sp. TaxID=213418 RepID=UPI002629A345|nr:hypothetical protein [uncultured Brevundimonas sp.]
MDQTDQIERIEAFEEKFGVKFEGLYAAFGEEDEDGAVHVVVRGEAHARSKTSKISECVEIVVAVYDDKDRVIGKGEHYLSEDSFFGFEVFVIDLYNVPRTPTRIRLYPKAN